MFVHIIVPLFTFCEERRSNSATETLHIASLNASSRASSDLNFSLKNYLDQAYFNPSARGIHRAQAKEVNQDLPIRDKQLNSYKEAALLCEPYADKCGPVLIHMPPDYGGLGEYVDPRSSGQAINTRSTGVSVLVEGALIKQDALTADRSVL